MNREITKEQIEKMRELRKTKTLREVAKELDIAKSTVYTYTNGKHKDLVIHKNIFNIEGLGQLRISTIAKLIEKGIIKIKLSESLKRQLENYDAIKVDDSNGIIIKGFKKILEVK